jgi:hypothetical protein
MPEKHARVMQKLLSPLWPFGREHLEKVHAVTEPSLACTVLCIHICIDVCSAGSCQRPHDRTRKLEEGLCKVKHVVFFREID